MFVVAFLNYGRVRDAYRAHFNRQPSAPFDSLALRNMSDAIAQLPVGDPSDPIWPYQKILIRSAVKLHFQEQGRAPLVLMLVPMESRQTNCLATHLADLIRHNLKRDCWQLNELDVRSILTASDPFEVQRRLEFQLRVTEGRSRPESGADCSMEKIFVVRNFDLLPPEAVTPFFTWCDTEEALYKNSVWLLVLGDAPPLFVHDDRIVASGGVAATDRLRLMEQATENYLRQRWHSPHFNDDKLAALFARVSNNVVFIPNGADKELCRL